MAVAVQALSKLSFFSGLENDVLSDIAPHIGERSFSPSQVVILEGEPCRAVYFVAQGVVRMHRLSPEGREHVLAYIGPGESFNLVPALDGGPTLASVDAMTDTVLYTIPCELFQRILRDHHEVALAVMGRLATEVRRLSDMVEDLALHTVRTRLARFLLAHASAELGEVADGTQPPKRWTQEEIAAHIGTVRDVVGRALRTFADEGLIRRERGRLVVMDRAGLEREAMK
ncbi:MAG: cyclic nucleotide-binding domain-containing protein [Anaerolineae bacterium]|nr:cyclic nucleotide-binding domain-containing protein [Anaerolineae bacterium]